jgi:hypothetical protein
LVIALHLVSRSGAGKLASQLCEDDVDSSGSSDALPDSVKAWTLVNKKKKKRKEISPVSGDVIRKNESQKRESKRIRKSPVPL